jgi:hypothetical protein
MATLKVLSRGLNTVLNVLMHHAQLGGQVVLHNEVDLYGRYFENYRITPLERTVS